jgi:hypothetical protein
MSPGTETAEHTSITQPHSRLTGSTTTTSNGNPVGARDADHRRVPQPHRLGRGCTSGMAVDSGLSAPCSFKASISGEDGRVPADNLARESRPFASPVEVPLTADSVGPPRLTYGGLDLFSADGGDQAYTAVYFEVAASGGLGRVTFEERDAVRASRGEHLPFDYDHAGFRHGDWVYVVGQSQWMRERHDYETRHYATPLLETHRHYLFVFHDEFVEAIAAGIWLDLADRADPFAAPISHPCDRSTWTCPARGLSQPVGWTGS